MDFWLILDGEKAGPFPDYEIRSRITSGELERQTPAWHDGLAGWQPLGELAWFRDEFDRVEVVEERAVELEPGAVFKVRGTPPPLPVPRSFGRRFWARWLDLHIYLAVWWLGMWAVGRSVTDILGNVPIMVLQLAPWFVLEAILIHRMGTTPGKWLLGIRVVNDDGSRLSLTAAVLRSVWVYAGGLGFGVDLLLPMCQFFSWLIARNLGRPLWDHHGRHRVEVQPLVGWRITVLIVGIFTALQLQMAVLAPVALRQIRSNEELMKAVPGLEKYLIENPPWHLPER